QDSGTAYQFGGPPLPVVGTHAAQLGAVALLVAIGYVLWRAHRAIENGAPEGRVLTLAAAVSGLLAFALLTRMHERYMFVSLVCFAPLLFARQLRIVYGLLSGLFLLNLWFAFAYFNARTSVEDLRFQPFFDWLFGGLAADSTQNKIYSLAVVGTALVVAWRGIGWVQLLGEPPVEVQLPTVDTAPALGTTAARRRRMTVPLPAGRFARRVPLAVVGLVCVYCLVILRGELRAARYLNDSAFHL